MNEKKLQFAIDIIDKRVEKYAKRCDRIIVFQIIFTVVGYYILKHPNFEIKFFLTPITIPPSLIKYAIFAIILQLFFNWGYYTFHYVVILNKFYDILEEYLEVRYDNCELKEQDINIFNTKDIKHIFLPVSIINFFYYTHPTYAKSITNRIIYSIFGVIIFIIHSLSVAILVRYSIVLTGMPLLDLHILIILIVVISICYWQFYRAINDDWFRKWVWIMVLVNILSVFFIVIIDIV